MEKQRAWKEDHRYCFLPVTVRSNPKRKLALRIPINELSKSQGNHRPRIFQFNVNSPVQQTPQAKGGHYGRIPASASTTPEKDPKTLVTWRIVGCDRIGKATKANHTTIARLEQTSSQPVQGLLSKNLRGVPINNIPNVHPKMADADASVISRKSTLEVPPEGHRIAGMQLKPALRVLNHDPQTTSPDLLERAAESDKKYQPGPKLPVAGSVENIHESNGRVLQLFTLAANAVVPSVCLADPPSQAAFVSQRSQPPGEKDPRHETGTSKLDEKFFAQRGCASPESGIDCDEDNSYFRSPDGEQSPQCRGVSGKTTTNSENMKPLLVTESQPRKRAAEAGRRYHKNSERNRRREMRASFVALRNLLTDDDKIAKVAILKRAREHCLSLRMQEITLLSQKVGLTSRRCYLEQALKNLVNADCPDLSCSTSITDAKEPLSLTSRTREEIFRMFLEARKIKTSVASSSLRDTSKSSPGLGAVRTKSISLLSKRGVTCSSGSGMLELDESDMEVDVVGLHDVKNTGDTREVKQPLDEDGLCDLTILNIRSLANERSAAGNYDVRGERLPNCSRLCIETIQDTKTGGKRALILNADYSVAASRTSVAAPRVEQPMKKLKQIADETNALVKRRNGCGVAASRFSRAARVNRRRRRWPRSTNKRKRLGRSDGASLPAFEIQKHAARSKTKNSEKKSGSKRMEDECEAKARLGRSRESHCRVQPSSAPIKGATLPSVASEKAPCSRNPSGCELDETVSPDLSHGGASVLDVSERHVPSQSAISPSQGEILGDDGFPGTLSAEDVNEAEDPDGKEVAETSQPDGCPADEKSSDEGPLCIIQKDPCERSVNSDPDDGLWDSPECEDRFSFLEDVIKEPFEVGCRGGSEPYSDGECYSLGCAFDEEDQSLFTEEEEVSSDCCESNEYRYFDLKSERLGHEMFPVVSLGRIDLSPGVRIQASGFEEGGLPHDRKSIDIAGSSKPNRISELRQKLKQREADLQKVRENMVSIDDISAG